MQQVSTLSAFFASSRDFLFNSVHLFPTLYLFFVFCFFEYDLLLKNAPEIKSADSRNAVDVTYISSMWNLANIVQSTVCTPRSLSLPISSSPTQRTSLIASFHRIYMSFPAPFRTFTEASICDLARRSKRLARQTLFLTSNYFHCLMLIYADEHEQLDIDVQGTLDAAHEAINSFFLLCALFEDEAMVWYHFQHRAFSEAVSPILRAQHVCDLSRGPGLIGILAGNRGASQIPKRPASNESNQNESQE